MPKVTIDGKTFEAGTGETILQVARRNGVWIPTLCHHDALEPYGACRLCVVEINRGDWWQVVTACNYPVRRDLQVRANSERIQAARRGLMQLLLARSPDSPELRRLAAKLGVVETPYPTVTKSQRNCILCGMCVRVCEERIGAAAISIVGRGVDRSVAAPFYLPSEDCIGCGACAEICPVGTITIRYHEEEVEISPFKTKVKIKRCQSCGKPLASQLVRQALEKRGGPTLVEILARTELCPTCKRQQLAGKMAAAIACTAARETT